MRLLLSLLLGLSLPAFAQHDHHASPPPATARSAPLSDGTIKKIDQTAGEVVIQHGQLDSIGKLFTRTKDQKVKTELVFWITPHILRKKTDYKIITPPAEAERLRGQDSCPTPGPSKEPTGTLMPPFSR